MKTDYFNYDPKEQSALIDQLQTATIKLAALLNHLSGEGYDSFLRSEDNQHGILWLAQGLAEEIGIAAQSLLVAQ